jgi:hypothetical protein
MHGIHECFEQRTSRDSARARETHHFVERGRASRLERCHHLADLLIGERIDQLDELDLVVRRQLARVLEVDLGLELGNAGRAEMASHTHTRAHTKAKRAR